VSLPIFGGLDVKLMDSLAQCSWHASSPTIHNSKEGIKRAEDRRPTIVGHLRYHSPSDKSIGRGDRGIVQLGSRWTYWPFAKEPTRQWSTQAGAGTRRRGLGC